MAFTDLPLGFGFMLAENQVALNVYAALPQEDKQAVIDSARQADSPEQMHKIISSLATKGGLV